jgi:hypothetical protein
MMIFRVLFALPRAATARLAPMIARLCLKKVGAGLDDQGVDAAADQAGGVPIAPSAMTTRDAWAARSSAARSVTS